MEARIISYKGNDFRELEMDYDQVAITDLKMSFDGVFRMWQPSRRRWLIHKSIVRDAKVLLVRHGYDIGEVLA